MFVLVWENTESPGSNDSGKPKEKKASDTTLNAEFHRELYCLHGISILCLGYLLVCGGIQLPSVSIDSFLEVGYEDQDSRALYFLINL